MRRLKLFAALAAFASGASHAQTLELEPGQAERRLAPAARYVELPGTPGETLSQALALPPTAYAPLDKRYIDFGNTPNTIWLRFDLHNDSAGAGRWMLSLNVRFMTGILAYLDADAGGVLLRQTEDSTFDQRPIPHRVLAVPFSLAAGERAELLIGYRSKGTTAMPVSIETVASHEARYAREDAMNLAAYAAVAFLIVLTLLQSFAFRQPSQFTYAFYLSATLAYIVHMDGLTFQFLWPQQPAWNSYAAIPFGLVMSAAALLFARSFTETSRVAPAYDKMMLALIGVAVLTNFGGLVTGEAQVKAFAYLVASTTAAACLGAGVLAYWRKRPAMRFFVIGWIGVFTGVLLTSIVSNFPALIPRTAAMAIPKLTIMFDTLMFYMALADRSRELRVERDLAMRRELEALQRQHEITQKLHDAERERLEALVVAQAKSRQLAMASHDIRQPLTSLRLTLDRLAGIANLEPMAAGFKQSLDYLDGLTKEYGAESGPGEAPRAAGTGAEEDVFEVKALLENIDLMFGDEARAKGLVFRCRAEAALVRGDAMATMRIVSNLVANAIKYTGEGKILVGCRKRSGHVTLIVADTGPGIPADELERVLEANERGSTARGTEGQGLGLGIASALAAQHGYDFRCRSIPGRGTAFFVDVPRSASAAGGGGSTARGGGSAAGAGSAGYEAGAAGVAAGAAAT